MCGIGLDRVPIWLESGLGNQTSFVRHLLMKVHIHIHICWSLLINLMITANHCTSGFTVLFEEEKINFGVAIQKIQFATSPGRLRHSLMRVHNHIYWPLLINLLITGGQFDDHCWSHLLITADHICWSLLVNLMITADRIYWSLLVNLMITVYQFDDYCWSILWSLLINLMITADQFSWSLHFRGYGTFWSI